MGSSSGPPCLNPGSCREGPHLSEGLHRPQPWIVYLHSRNKYWKMKTKTSRNLDSEVLGGKAESVMISQAGLQRGFHPNTEYLWERTLPFLNAVFSSALGFQAPVLSCWGCILLPVIGCFLDAILCTRCFTCSPHLIITIQWGRHHDYAYFTNKETDTERGQVICSRS